MLTPPVGRPAMMLEAALLIGSKIATGSVGSASPMLLVIAVGLMAPVAVARTSLTMREMMVLISDTVGCGRTSEMPLTGPPMVLLVGSGRMG